MLNLSKERFDATRPWSFPKELDAFYALSPEEQKVKENQPTVFHIKLQRAEKVNRIAADLQACQKHKGNRITTNATKVTQVEDDQLLDAIPRIDNVMIEGEYRESVEDDSDRMSVFKLLDSTERGDLSEACISEAALDEGTKKKSPSRPGLASTDTTPSKSKSTTASAAKPETPRETS